MKVLRKVSVAGHILDVVCGVRESMNGPVFTASTVSSSNAETELENLQTHGTSMTAVANSFVLQVVEEIGTGQVDDPERHKINGTIFLV